jgi:hypothetical protein
MQEESSYRNTSEFEFLTLQLSHPHLSEIVAILSSTTSNQAISNKRKTICEWVSDFCRSLSIPQSTGLMACHYLDIFLHKKPEFQEKDHLELFVVVSVCVAHKSKNGVIVNPRLIQRKLGNRYSLDAIITTERFLLETVEWKLMIVTADDLIHCLCENTFSDRFGKVCEVACNLAVVSYWFSEIPAQGILVSAVSCVLVALKRLKFSQLIENWIGTVNKLVRVDWQIVFEVGNRFEEKLMNFSSG